MTRDQLARKWGKKPMAGVMHPVPDQFLKDLDKFIESSAIIHVKAYLEEQAIPRIIALQPEFRGKISSVEINGKNFPLEEGEFEINTEKRCDCGEPIVENYDPCCSFDCWSKLFEVDENDL